MVEQAGPVPLGTSDEAAGVCAHHWRIERPAGETSKGVCQLCGASRDFLNYGYRPVMSRSTRASSDRRQPPAPA